MKITLNVFFDGDGAQTPDSEMVTRSWTDFKEGRVGPSPVGTMEKWPLPIIPSYHDRFTLKFGNRTVGLFVTNRNLSLNEVVIDASCMSVEAGDHPLQGYSHMSSESKVQLFLDLGFSP